MLYAAVAARSFRRFSTYRAATLTGIFTNSVFGVIFSYAYLAVWGQDALRKWRSCEITISVPW